MISNVNVIEIKMSPNALSSKHITLPETSSTKGETHCPIIITSVIYSNTT